MEAYLRLCCTSLTDCILISGKVRLEKLALKPSVFDELGLPITVIRGTIEVINFDIPWKSIQSSPVIITISGLEVLLGPNTSAQGLIYVV